MDPEILSGWGMALIFVGILITLIAVVLLFTSGVKTSKEGKEKVKGGGAIIIGPFPIVFGTDKESIKKVLWLSLTLTILLVIVTVMFYLMSK